MNWRDNRIESALKGENPTVAARLKSGFVVLGDTQFLPGYCILIGCPVVKSLNDLAGQKRADFLADMALIGDAVTAVCKPLRLNYEILGNTDTFLHAHIFPRYEWEDEERKKKPVWLYPKENWSMGKYQFDEQKHAELKRKLSQKLEELAGGNWA